MTPDERNAIHDMLRAHGMVEAARQYQRLSEYTEQLEARLRRAERLVSVWGARAVDAYERDRTSSFHDADLGDVWGQARDELREALQEREP